MAGRLKDLPRTYAGLLKFIATDLAAHDVAINDLKTKLNAVLAKLDANSIVPANYVAQNAVMFSNLVSKTK